MTYEEAATKAPVRVYRTSEGDNYQTVANAIWKSNESKYIKCLFALNKRTDWDNLKADEEIKYLSGSVIEQVNEV